MMKSENGIFYLNINLILAKLKRNEFVLKLKECRHRISYKSNYKRMANAMKRYKSCENKKPLSQINKEINLCKRYWGCYPLHYFRYDLYKIDKQLSSEELINYIPEFFFYTLFLNHYDSETYSILLSDKNLTEQLFRSVGIMQPHTICKLINKRIFTRDLNSMNFKEVEHELKEKCYKKVFIKPTDGQGGYGIIIFHINNNGKYETKEGLEFNEEFLYKIGQNKNYIIQSGLNQDGEISKLYTNSINTFRITTENINGEIRVVCATLRLGKEGNEIDNGTQDGIVLGIDIGNGISKDYGITEEGRIFYQHPNTKYTFKGYKINKWNEIKEFTIGCAAKLPQFTYLGWDIALTCDGPVAIETNLGFGLDHYQVSLGGLREVFKIYNPSYYWNSLS